jgi:outer membrane protein OmpA-like peptidoglycan-associated protein
MKGKTILTLLLAISSALSAQDSIKTNKKNDYKWYLSVSGGAQMLFSSDVENLDFAKRITPAVSLTAGKWFSPLWGARLQIGGYSLNGYSTTEGLYLADPLDNGLVFGDNDPVRNEVDVYPDGAYRHYLRYINAHADLTLSLFNIFNKNNNSRWDIIPAIGIGYFGTFDHKGTPQVNSISTNYSLMGKFNACKGLDITLEISAAVLPGSFDGRITDKLYESTLSASVGLTYNFKACPKKKKKNAEEIRIIQIQLPGDTVTIEKIVTLEKGIKRSNFNLASIRFDLAKTSPKIGQEGQFVNISKYLTDNPEAKILIEGYGDRGTGSVETNLKISQQRAEAVKKILVNTYKVDETKIGVVGLGAELQPYETNDWNRSVIVTVVEE